MPENSNVELPPRWKELVGAARNVRAKAYAKYSNYHVGAAVLTAAGDIFVGCNVENASYGLTICAERSAVCAAIADGQQDIVAICISLTGQPVPCGTCRQFLYEFNPDMSLLLDNLGHSADQPPEAVCLAELLPRGFRLEN